MFEIFDKYKNIFETIFIVANISMWKLVINLKLKSVALVILSIIFSKYFERIKPSWIQFTSAQLSSIATEWSLKFLTIIVTETYHFWKSIRLMIERNTSGSWSFGFNLGEKGGVWLEDFEHSREETWFSSSWSWEIRVEFVSSRRFCDLIWFLNSLTSALSSLTSCLVLWLLWV